MQADVPEGRPVAVELPLSPREVDEIRRRAAEDALAPKEEDLLRYLVYLGAGYVEAERCAQRASSPEEAHAAVHAFYGRAGAASAVLRFRFSEASRLDAARRRARAAHELTWAIYAETARQLEQEIARRRERLRDLEAALSDADRAPRQGPR
jgi:hypothetical protein